MTLDDKLEFISICEHLRYGISSTRNYYENYLKRLHNSSSPILKNIINNLEYIIMTLNRVKTLLCTDSPNMFSAYNELDKLYTRVIGEQFVPGAIRATIYEIRYELKRLIYGEN